MLRTTVKALSLETILKLKYRKVSLLFTEINGITVCLISYISFLIKLRKAELEVYKTQSKMSNKCSNKIIY